MSWREMAIDGGASGEDEISRMATQIEDDWQRADFEQMCAEQAAREAEERGRWEAEQSGHEEEE